MQEFNANHWEKVLPLPIFLQGLFFIFDFLSLKIIYLAIVFTCLFVFACGLFDIYPDWYSPSFLDLWFGV